MNSIELTDAEGDAFAIITRGDSTWITCTSGHDEVTVGPFPTRLVRKMFLRGIEEADSTMSVLVDRAPSPSAQSTPVNDELDAQIRDRAWETFVNLSASAPVRDALDGALDIASLARSRAAVRLVPGLTHTSVAMEDAEGEDTRGRADDDEAATADESHSA